MNTTPTACRCVFALVLGAAATAQVEWVDRGPNPIRRNQGAMVYDVGRSVMTLFGGSGIGSRLSDTWERQGLAWQNRSPATSPPARYGPGLVHDPIRQRTVLFGGWDVDDFADTWEWDGTAWTQRTPATSPSPRWGHRLVWDAARGRAVMFGGFTGLPFTGFWHGDTWEWDGNSWIERTPTQSPSPRAVYAMTYDAARGVVLLFGGTYLPNSGTNFGDTWQWNGTDWTQLSSTGPSPRQHAAMAYDATRRVVVLFGGTTATPGGSLGDTWEWDGVRWTLVSSVGPAARYAHAMEYDPQRQRVVLFSGTGSPGGDTWEWDGQSWTEIGAATPKGRAEPALVYDGVNEAFLMFGGGNTYGGLGHLDDTWLWDGSAWTQPNPVASPPPRWRAGIAYDSARRRVVLFGGYDGRVGFLNDTWEWDGSQWIQMNPPRSPRTRQNGSMVYDAARQKVVLFGGNTGSGPPGPLTDTWEWDGQIWVERTPASRPPGLFHEAVYDPDRQRTLVFTSDIATNMEVWEWDGSNWTQIGFGDGPGPRKNFAVAHDARRGSTVLFGGELIFGALQNDTWEWNGRQWTERLAAAPPPARRYHAAAYDPRRHRIVVFGGHSVSATEAADLWDYGPVYAADSFSYGAGCPGSAGIPSLLPASWSLPWVGEGFTMTLAGVPPGQPATVFIGGSKTQWIGSPLPLDLSQIGMTGCAAHASLELPVATAAPPFWVVPIPIVSALLGQAFYGQALVASPGANRLGLVMSNALQNTIGAR